MTTEKASSQRQGRVVISRAQEKGKMGSRVDVGGKRNVLKLVAIDTQFCYYPK